MTTQQTQPSPSPSPASKYVQYSADVILYAGTVARRLCAAPTLIALAAARLLINVLHSQMQRRATVEEGAAVLDLVRQNIKSARRRGKKFHQEEKRIDIGDAFSIACSSGALEDIDGESDPFEAVVLARKYLEAYRVGVAGHPAPPVTLEDGAEFVAILTRCRKRGE